MASSSGNKRKAAGTDLVETSKLLHNVFVIIGFSNEAGRRSAAHLGRIYNTLPEYHQSFIDLKSLGMVSYAAAYQFAFANG